MTGEEEPSAVATVRARLLAGRIGEDRLIEHHAAGRVLLDGVPVASLDVPYPSGSRAIIASE